MPRKKKSKDPEEGACPRCRKLVPLVQADGGLLVLRTHHVVVAVEHYSGHEVEECPGSGGEPATLDDSEDWGWVAPAAEEITAADVRDEEHVLTTEQMADVMRASINGAAVREAMTTSTVPEGLRPAPSMSVAQRRIAMRHAARDLRDALETVLADVTGQRQSVYITAEPDGRGGAQLRGHIQPDGFQFATHVPAPALADPVMLDDMIRRATTEARTQLERRFRPSSAEFFRNAARSSEITDDDTPSDPIGRVLAEVRQAYIDVTGAPPDDGDVALEDHDFTNDLRTLTLRLRSPSGQLTVSTAVSPSVFGTPGYAEAVARDVGATVRRELRQQTAAALCDAPNQWGGHECGEQASDQPHEHRCRICQWRWHDPVTPSAVPPPHAHGA